MKRFTSALIAWLLRPRPILGCMIFASTAAIAFADAPVPPCGGVLASYKAVPAYSNDPMDQWTDADCDPNNIRVPYGMFGEQFQCVEYVKRFYYMALGFTGALSWTGNAVEYFSTAAAKNLFALRNGGHDPPAPNDILVFSGPNGYGHVAIVTSVTPSLVSFIEQNWSVTGTASLPILNTCTSTDCSFSVNDRNGANGSVFTVLGWLRASSASPRQITWLSFLEGNPGVPGDGTVISAGLDAYNIWGIPYSTTLSVLFQPSPLVSLAGVTNGFTLTVFPRNGPAITPSTVAIEVRAIHPPAGCPVIGWGIESGEIGSVSPALVNGVQGAAISVPQSSIQHDLDLVNHFSPTCHYQLSDMYLVDMLFSSTFNNNPSNYVTQLDATAFALGQNVVP